MQSVTSVTTPLRVCCYAGSCREAAAETSGAATAGNDGEALACPQTAGAAATTATAAAADRSRTLETVIQYSADARSICNSQMPSAVPSTTMSCRRCPPQQQQQWGLVLLCCMPSCNHHALHQHSLQRCSCSISAACTATLVHPFSSGVPATQAHASGISSLQLVACRCATACTSTSSTYSSSSSSGSSSNCTQQPSAVAAASKLAPARVQTGQSPEPSAAARVARSLGLWHHASSHSYGLMYCLCPTQDHRAAAVSEAGSGLIAGGCEQQLQASSFSQPLRHTGAPGAVLQTGRPVDVP